MFARLSLIGAFRRLSERGLGEYAPWRVRGPASRMWKRVPPLRVVSLNATLILSAISTLLLLRWTLIVNQRVRRTPTASPYDDPVTYGTSDLILSTDANDSLDILAVDPFPELATGVSPLRIPADLEQKALALCRRQPSNVSRTYSASRLVVPSVIGYQCDLLERCHQEYERLAELHRDNICPCLPDTLIGKVHINPEELENTSWTGLRLAHKSLLPGGHWKPRDCVPRRRVAVIVPYRDRQRHLRAFLAHVHPILQRQKVEYRIFVVEQNMPYRFNKASLMNVGYLEAIKLFNMDCVLFHDVDTLIERDDNMVICGDKPIHFAAYADRHRYRLHQTLFGSAVLLTREAFESANGFSNLYYGWGAEDDDFRARLLKKKFQIYKGPNEIARCTLLKHKRDVLFTNANYRGTAFIYRYASRKTQWYDIDGLNSIDYSVLKIKELPLFTWIHTDLKVPKLASNTRRLRIPSQMMKNVNAAFKQSPSDYDVTKGRCVGDGSAEMKRQFLSLVTCRYLCDTNRQCFAIEYHHGDFIDDDFCYLITEPGTCYNTTSGNAEVHLKKRPL